MPHEDRHLIGKTIAEIDALTAAAATDNYNPETDWDPLVQAAKIRQAESDASLARSPSESAPASDALAVTIARIEVELRKTSAH